MLRTLIIIIAFLINFYETLNISKSEAIIVSYSSLLLGNFTYALTWSRWLIFLTFSAYLIKSKHLRISNIICKFLLTLSLPFHISITIIHAYFIFKSPLLYLNDLMNLQNFYRSVFLDILANSFSLFALVLVWCRVSIYINRLAKYTFIFILLIQLVLIYLNYSVFKVWPYDFMNVSDMPYLYFFIFTLISLTILIFTRHIERKRRVRHIKNKKRKRY